MNTNTSNKTKNPKVLVAQMEITPFDQKENFKRAQKYFEIAHENNCDFIIFPEKFNGIITILEYDDYEVRRFIKNIQRLCEKYKIYCIAGSVIIKDGDYHYNRSYLIGRYGNIIGHYDKVALYASERKWLKKGYSLPVFETEFGKIGIQICRDLLHPELTLKMKKKGADIIFMPSLWSSDSNVYNLYTIRNFSDFPKNSEKTCLDTLTLARAIESNVYLIFCNMGGVYESEEKIVEGKREHIEYYEKSAGRSSINQSILGKVKLLKSYKEDYIIDEVDLSYLTDYDDVYDTFNDDITTFEDS